MSVAVAHQESRHSQIALREAGREASLRGTSLTVIHVVESLDLDLQEAYTAGLSDEVNKALAEAGSGDISWELQLVTGEENVSHAVLAKAAEAGAEILVIGARRRSPVGKFLLGSVTQNIILDADLPVLVVKPKA